MEHTISSTRLPNLQDPDHSVMVDGACLSKTSDPIGTERTDDPSVEPKTAQDGAAWSPAEVVIMSEESGAEDDPVEGGSERGSPEESPKDRIEFVNEKGITFRTAIPKNDGKFVQAEINRLLMNVAVLTLISLF